MRLSFTSFSKWRLQVSEQNEFLSHFKAGSFCSSNPLKWLQGSRDIFFTKYLIKYMINIVT